MPAWDDSLPHRPAAFGRWQPPTPPGLGTQLHVIGNAISRSTFGQRVVVGFFTVTTLALVTACAWLLAQRNSMAAPMAPAMVAQVSAGGAAQSAVTAPAGASDEQWLAAARTKLAKKRAALLKAEERYQKLRAAKGRDRATPKQLVVAAKKVKAAQVALNRQLDSVLGPELKNATASAR